MALNDLIFRELFKRGVTLGRVWNLTDSKLWYVTPEQAQGYIDLEHSAAYALVQIETGIIEEHIDEIVRHLSDASYNVVDLGCGNGEKARLVIQKISPRIQVRYCPVDISAYMVSQALETMRKLGIGTIVECKVNISDFENLPNVMPVFRQNGYHASLVLILGNTIGNFERDELLAGIQESTILGDYVLIGTELSDQQKQEEIIKKYSAQHVRAFSNNLLRNIGLNDEDTEFHVEFNENRAQVYHIMKTDRTVRHLGRETIFKAGDRINTIWSYKYTQEELSTALTQRFSEVHFYSTGTYVLALCKK